MPVLIVGNQLYIGEFFTAQGAVSDLVGTWAYESMTTEWDYNSGDYKQTYHKYEVIFTNSNFTWNYYSSYTGTYGIPFDTISGTYTYSNGTLTMTPIGENTKTGKISILNNKYLFMMDNETSPSAYAYLKQ